MPYKVKKQGDKYVVYKKDTGKRVGATAGNKEALRKYMASITPDLDLTFDYVSPYTGEMEALRIPFGMDFFYPAE